MTTDETRRAARDATPEEPDSQLRPGTTDDADTAGHIVFPQAQVDLIPQGTPQALPPLAPQPTSDLKRGKNNAME